ncbi:MAG: glycosyltransferase involved in cell wall biosynthesis [Flavobacterium sp.]|jgi:glycosyltransferase involved in cell wall biosynthesis
MLSILIPTFNYNVYRLVLEIKQQCDLCGISYEIIVQDDASNSVLNEENKKINQLANCVFYQNEINQGRSKNRNLLAEKATFDWLLFLDADTFPKKSNFISVYLENLNQKMDAINGGIVYQNQKPKNTELLRWIYGIKREALSSEVRNKNEYLSFLTLNFLIKKSVFKVVKFNEEIPNLRHEDTLFSFDLKNAKFKVLHINNPVIHLGLDTSEEFLIKSEEAVKNLNYLFDKQLISQDYVGILNLSKQLKNYHLSWVFTCFFGLVKWQIKKNVLGKKPNLFLFDLYRLNYLLSLETTSNK